MLMNPGGPPSPAAVMAFLGKSYAKFIDKPGKQHYEWTGVDPRGIGNTLPRAHCAPGDSMTYAARNYVLGKLGPIRADKTTLIHMLAEERTHVKRREDTEKSLGEVFPFVGTASTARDLVAVIDKIAESRGWKPPAEPKGPVGSPEKGPGMPRLNYMGFSYGTLLGSYFASMFPGRVGRLRLDGVMDIKHQSTGVHISGLVDLDKILVKFFKGCHTAGAEKCSLARKADDSYKDTEARFWDMIKKLENEPQATWAPRLKQWVTMTVEDLMIYVWARAYGAYTDGPWLADVLDHVIKGNFTRSTFMHQFRQLKNSCGTSPWPVLALDGMTAISAADAYELGNVTISWLQEQVRYGEQVSKISSQAPITLRNAAWPYRDRMGFRGPFTTPRFSQELTPGVPAAPILFLSNRLDPVTPLASARKIQAMHPESKLIIQEIEGHCAFKATKSSPCVNKLVQEYFDSGKVPDLNQITFSSLYKTMTLS
ncbi:hypothetical protein VHEMI02133 [[Torrubiella] hemipterigena]|uniref:Peptidase S33 tripeptidyl aminopeptidase-like C-terminal domain-containing protein n=1 Tax=[Torrubiella] hemipterigena TaxID=1531966 RepID=A0A0A1SUY0_9HYPO|nr:hypothetical protein VHEMI02133 [[Torrubiella] hemipterigena]